MTKLPKFLFHLFLGLLITFSIVFWQNSKLEIKAQETPTISNVAISPLLDISLFSPYTITADISNLPEGTTPSINISGVNGDGGSVWNYYADGATSPENLNFDMTLDTGVTWKKTGVYPDYIYPEIYFAPSSVTWNNTPLNWVVRRNDYQLFHFSNPFSMTDEMSFWIEFNATARATNSADLLVYLVEKDHDISYFTENWFSKTGVELVGTIDSLDTFHHTHHPTNSSHFLISLATNPNGTIGLKNLNVQGDFWIVLYNNSPNNNRGWNLRYHPSSLCTISNRWYKGNQVGWTTSVQTGCPDAHIHVARRVTGTKDGVKSIITAGSAISTDYFYFGDLPNLAPNSTTFTNPLAGTYDQNIEVSWEPATDANGDSLTYNIYLTDSSGNVLSTLAGPTSDTSFTWNITEVDNGTYGLKGEVCDTEPLCTDFYTQSNFIIDKSSPASSLTTISISSSNSNSSQAKIGDSVILTFTSSGEISTPTVSFYSAGSAVSNSISISSSGNNWTATYIVSSQDSGGQVSFVISSINLDSEYLDTTDATTVNVDTYVHPPTTSAQPETCQNKAPIEKPDLFQINTNGTQAIVFYTPVSDPVTGYYISFSTKSNAFEHGVMVPQGESSGVLSHRINYLKPNTTYYFMVRPQNGCATGVWSDSMKANTLALFDKNFAPTYKFSQLLNRFVLSNKTQAVKTGLPDDPILEIPPEANKVNEPEPSPQAQTKRRCFLFWCFNSKK